MPVEIEVHTLPHFKAPVNSKVEPWGLDGAGIFTCTSEGWSGAVKHIKWAFFKTQFVATVSEEGGW